MIIRDAITCQRTQMILGLCDRAWFAPKSLQSIYLKSLQNIARKHNMLKDFIDTNQYVVYNF